MTTNRLTMREAAELWAVTPQIVHHWTTQGRLKCFTLDPGGKWSAAVADVQRAKILKPSGVARMLGVGTADVASLASAASTPPSSGRYSLRDVAAMSGARSGPGETASPSEPPPPAPLPLAALASVEHGNPLLVEVARARERAEQRRRGTAAAMDAYLRGELEPRDLPDFMFDGPDAPEWVPRYAESWGVYAETGEDNERRPWTRIIASARWDFPYFEPDDPRACDIDIPLVLKPPGDEYQAGLFFEGEPVPWLGRRAVFEESRRRWDAECQRRRPGSERSSGAGSGGTARTKARVNPRATIKF